MLLETLSWWGEWVTQLYVKPWKQNFHSVFHKVGFGQEELLMTSTSIGVQIGCRKGQTLVWQPKRGSWSFFIPHISSPSVLLLCGTRDVLHKEEQAQPEKCWLSSRLCSMDNVQEVQKFRKGIFQPHAVSFLQLSINLCLFYIIFILLACLV